MAKTDFADRMKQVAFSPSLAVIGRVREMRAAGIEIIDFSAQGATPDIARRAAADMMNQDASSFYTDPRGLPVLRETIAAKLAAENAIDADPDTDVIVTVGAKQAIFATMLALVDKGDEVIVEDPGYISFAPLIRLAGATPVTLPLVEDDKYRFPVDRLRGCITKKTRLLLLCNPHNPTGRCLSNDELTEISSIAMDNDIRVLVDEAYEHYIYDGVRHVSMASLPGMKERTVTVQTMSKVYNMGGWRVGWLAGPLDIVKQVLAVHTQTVTCPTSFAQAGASAAIRAKIGEGNLPIPEIVNLYQRRRDVLVDELCSIPDVSCVTPAGAYFAFPNIARYGLPSLEMSPYLLETAHVATTPGSAFGEAGEGHVRLVFKADVDVIRQGIARIKDALSNLEPKSGSRVTAGGPDR